MGSAGAPVCPLHVSPLGSALHQVPGVFLPRLTQQEAVCPDGPFAPWGCFGFVMTGI